MHQVTTHNMFRRLLSSFAVTMLLVAPTTLALAVDTTADTPRDVIQGFSTTNSSFNPNSQSVTVNYTLTETVRLYTYVYATSTNEIVTTFVANTATASGPVSHIWYGRVGNVQTGAVLPNGEYQIKSFASNAGGFILDSAVSVVTINGSSNPNPTAPQITNLNASPSTFDPEENEKSTFSFTTDQSANVTLEVKYGAMVVRSFSDFDGDSLAAGFKSIQWDGRNNSGNIVSEGTYTVRAFVQNVNGSREVTTNVVVDYDNSQTSGLIIENFDLNPSGTWDPTDEELEISFELNRDVDSLEVYAQKGSNKIDILDENDADEDDYEENWDGTDEDSDYVDAGTWTIVIEADNDKLTKTIVVEYEKPEITEAFVTKTSFDPSIDEVTNLVFKVDAASVVTVDVYEGSKKLITLMDEEEVSKNTWYSVEWDGYDDDGDLVDDGSNFEFRIRTENEVDDKIFDTETVSVTVDEDEVSSKKTNVTNDFVTPVIFDTKNGNQATISYCLDDAAETTLTVYKGKTASGSVEAELFENVNQARGCHTVKWNGEDEDGKMLKDGIYTYKLVSEANGSNKDTESGRFVIGKLSSGTNNNNNNGGSNNNNTGSCSVTYSDVTSLNQELCEAITWATGRGIFSGYTDGTFRPYNNINRAEVLKVLFETFRGEATILPANGSNFGFRDVNPSEWYAPYVRTAKFYGMLHGYLNQTEARLGNYITRVEMLKFALEAADAFTNDYEIPTYETPVYSDMMPRDASQFWFYDYAGESQKYNLFNSYNNNLEPAKLTQRGEVAIMLYRMHLAGLLD